MNKTKAFIIGVLFFLFCMALWLAPKAGATYSHHGHHSGSTGVTSPTGPSGETGPTGLSGATGEQGCESECEVTPTPTAEPTPESTPKGDGFGLPGDGKSDNRSDGKSSCPGCTLPPEVTTFAKTGSFERRVIVVSIAITGVLLGWGLYELVNRK